MAPPSFILQTYTIVNKQQNAGLIHKSEKSLCPQAML